MKILITGGTGLIGQEIGKKLTQDGHEIVVVTRNRDQAKKTLSYAAQIIECDLNTTSLNKNVFDGVEGLIHLAGESVDGRWTQEKKDKILQSRLNSTANLLRNCPSTVKTLVSASAQGFYGNRHNDLITEDSSRGEGFLAEVCEAWENQLQKHFQNRLVIFRIGLVLTKKGGVLQKLVSLFKKNLGAVLGSGEQWMSYISLEDVSDLFVKAICDEKYSGIINAVNNHAVTNAEFTKTLTEVLGVIQLPNVPEFVLKTTLGEMAELVLSSLKVESNFLRSQGYAFKDTNLKTLLSIELASHRDNCTVFYCEQYIAAPIEKVFSFFSDAQNLEKITPEILHFRIDKVSTSKIEQGTLIDYKLKVHGFPVKWRTRIDHWVPPFEFVDFQLSGPYKLWSHRHVFKSVGNGTLMIDEVRYKVPMGGIGNFMVGGLVASDVEKIFNYRREIIAETAF